MSDHCEEQEMEAEALEAIFDHAFEVVNGEQPFKWSVKLFPVDCAGDEEAEEEQNHIGIKLVATIPLDYPESLPQISVEIVKGLTDDHAVKLAAMAMEEAQNNEGMPAVYSVCEVLREWLADNNMKGLDDASMHAQMMRRAKEEEQKKVRAVAVIVISRSQVTKYSAFLHRRSRCLGSTHFVLARLTARTRSLPRYRYLLLSPSRRWE
jgi:hypothetical protein